MSGQDQHGAGSSWQPMTGSPSVSPKASTSQNVSLSQGQSQRQRYTSRHSEGHGSTNMTKAKNEAAVPPAASTSASSSASSSSSPAATAAATANTNANSNKSSRARVSMACIHCRQRKIRCDGQQPTCSTCFRLGRFCVYESISEIENLMTRERKKRSKEAKQSRLNSLAGLGIPIPASHMTSSDLQTHPVSIHSTSMYPSSRPSVGVIRDSRLYRQERTRPYMVNYPSAVPLLQQPSQEQQQQQQQQQSQLLIKTPTMQRRIHSDSNVPQQTGRRRGTTTGSYNDSIGGLSPGTPFSVGQSDNQISVTSLSQPTTPEATYSMHASILSHELSRSHSQSPADAFAGTPLPLQPSISSSSLSSSAVNFGSMLPATADVEGSSVHGNAASFLPTFDYSPSPAHQSEVPSFSSRSSGGGDATTYTTATSTASLTNTAVNVNSPSLLQRMSSTFPDLEQQLAFRRRSSFDVGDFWRKTSVADAAVANFFDRVLQAKQSRRGSFEASASPPTATRSIHNLVEAASNASTATGANATAASSASSSSSPQHISSLPGAQQYPVYNTFQEVMQSASPLTAPYPVHNSVSNAEALAFSHPFTLGAPAMHHHRQESSGAATESEDPQSTCSSPSHNNHVAQKLLHLLLPLLEWNWRKENQSPVYYPRC